MENKTNQNSVPAGNVIYLKKEITDPDHNVPYDVYQAFLMNISTRDVVLKKPSSFRVKVLSEGETGDIVTIHRKNILAKNNCYNICDPNADYPDTPYINLKIGEYSGDVRPFNSSYEGMHHSFRENYEQSPTDLLSLENVMAEIKLLNEESLEKALQNTQVLF